MSLAVRAAVAAAVLAVVAASPASADWREPFGLTSRINFEEGRNAGEPWLAMVAGRPTLAWDEDNTAPGAGNSAVIRVAQLDLARGREWDALEGAISRVPTASSAHPSVADVGGEPWVAWAENFNAPAAQIRVARPSPAGGWERVDDRDRPINQTAGTDDLSHADNPVIVDGGDERPYVAFWQFVLGAGSVINPSGMAAPASVWVVRLNTDGQWGAVGGGPVNPRATPAGEDGIKDAVMADIAVVGGRVWVTYLQAVKQGSGLSLLVRAARLNAAGTGWEQVAPMDIPSGFQADFRAPDIADVGGAPMVAVNVASTGPRIYVARPRDNGSGWDPVGGGFVSDIGATQGSLAEVGGTAWMVFTTNGAGGAARLSNGAWVPAGGPIRDARNSFSGTARLAAAGGEPWVAFTAEDGSKPPQPDERSCCRQVRAARLVPDFGATTVYPAATTAAVLGGVDTFGLTYTLGLETTPQGGSPIPSAFAPLNATQALGELRGLAPGTVHTVRPFAIAGTPAKVYGPAVEFVTPPDGERPATPAAPAPIAPAVAAAPRGPLVLGILRAPARLRSGHTLRLHVFSTEAGTAHLVARRDGRVVRRITRAVRAGRWSLSFKPPRATRGFYRVTVTVRTTDGRGASDAITVRMVR